jgi:predicted oxidoreductase
MKRIRVGGAFEASAVSLGLWRVGKMTQREVDELVLAAYESGVDFFDTADIYAGGRSEELLGAAVRDLGLRDKVRIQTKAAIRKGMYDFSADYLRSAVEASLKRLGLDHIDVLLLHRNDALGEPEEVAGVFAELRDRGLVRRFGVSNHTPLQIELLNRAMPDRLVANQMQFSVVNASLVDQGIYVNTTLDRGTLRDGGLLDYARLTGLTIQAWSPLQFGFFEGCFLGHEKFPELNAELSRLSAETGFTPAAVAFAWILRHPAGIQPIAGTTSPAHIREICAAADWVMPRADWYRLYAAAGHKLP